jgi:hypothetical protein
MNGLVSHTDKQRVGIGIRVDGNGLDAHLLGGFDDTACNLTTVGNQNFVKSLVAVHEEKAD